MDFMDKTERRARIKEMVNQGVLYLVMANAKKNPIKRADFNRIVCGGASPKILKRVLTKVQNLLEKVVSSEY